MSQDQNIARAAAKAKAQFFYDLQRLRIATGNRVARAEAHDNAILTPEDRTYFTATCAAMGALEVRALKEAERACQHVSVYPWLRGIDGIGPTMAMVIVSQFDPYRAPRPSNFWSFAGLNVLPDGTAPRPAKGLVKGDGTPGLPYNAWLRSKLIGVLAGAFLRARKGEGNADYAPIYHAAKHRHATGGKCGKTAIAHGVSGHHTWHPSGKVGGPPKDGDWCTAGHIHRKATRHMIKLFLVDLWKEWRDLEGLDVCGSYIEGVLGHEHHGDKA